MGKNKKPKTTAQTTKTHTNDESEDAKPTYVLPVRPQPQGLRMKTNHFRLGCATKDSGDYTHWYQYPLSNVQYKSGSDQTGNNTNSQGNLITTLSTGTSQNAAPTIQTTTTKPERTTSTTISGVAPRNPSVRVIRRVKRLFCQELKAQLKDIPMVTDLQHKLLTAKPLPNNLIGREHEVNFTDEYETQSRSKYTLTLGEQKVIKVGEALQYLSTNHADHLPDQMADNVVKEVVAAINVIFSHYANAMSIRTSRTEPFYSMKKDTMYRIPDSLKFNNAGEHKDANNYAWDLDGELIALLGYIRSTRAIRGACDPFLLRINTKTSPFFYGARTVEGHRSLQQLMDNYYSADTRRRWQDIEQYITGLRVRTDYVANSNTFYPGDQKPGNERTYKISGLPYTDTRGSDYWDRSSQSLPNIASVSFTAENRQWTVQQWFKEKHQVDLTRKMDTTWVVRIGKEVFLPATNLFVLPGQPYTGSLPQPIAAGCRKPTQNLHMILEQGLKEVFRIERSGTPSFDFGRDFGLTLENVPMSIDCSLLTAPTLQYSASAIPGKPSWNLTDKKFNATVTSSVKWTYVHLHSKRPIDQVHVPEFQKAIAKALPTYGLENLIYEDTPGGENHHHFIPVDDRSEIESALQKWYEKWQTKVEASKLQILLVLLDVENFYPAVKRWGDLKAGLATICKRPRNKNWSSIDSQTYGNLCLKVNQKSSPRATNHCLASQSQILSQDTMLVGMDVTHPVKPVRPPREKSIGKVMALKPSIAAMVASIDKEFTQYPASLRYNDSPDVNLAESTEEIFDLAEMLDERLKAYQKHNDGRLPKRIIFFRDGLSEDQLENYYKTESARLTTSISRRYATVGAALPETMWMCTVKRHETRFFADNTGTSAKHVKPDGNPVSGVAFFNEVTNGRGSDFYLVSADTIKGTARPTHYVVLENSVKISDKDNRSTRTPTIQEIAEMVYQLCFVYCKATKAVGLVTPSKLADKACDRARCYVESMYTNTQGNETAATARPNIQVHENVRDIMYYI